MSNSSARSTTTRWGTLRGKALLAIVAAGLALLAAEAALRATRGPADLQGCYRVMCHTQLTRPDWPEFLARQAAMREACRAQGMERARSHPVLSFCYNPGYRLVLGDYRLSINSHALRGEDFPAERPADEFRVLCLGGSTTAGEEVSDDETYPAQLQQMLRTRFPDRAIRVINGGVPSYDTRQSLWDYALRLWRLKPQVVTVYHAINDLPTFGEVELEIKPSQNYAPHALSPFVLEGDAAPQTWRQFLGALGRPLAGKSHLLALAKRAVHQVRPPRQSLVGTEETGVAAFVGSYRALLREIAASGATPLPITFAAAWPGEFSEAERKIVEASFAIWIKQTGAAWGREMLDRMNDETRRLSGELATPLCEAADLPASGETFVDACHLTVAGNRLLAERLVRAIEPLIERNQAGLPRASDQGDE